MKKQVIIIPSTTKNQYKKEVMDYLEFVERCFFNKQYACTEFCSNYKYKNILCIGGDQNDLR